MGVQMPIRFKEYEDVHLRNSPLKEVICQIRFHPILRIANEDPVNFQEAIRNRFPEIQIEHPFLIGPLGIETPKAEPKPRVFRFKDQGANYSVALAPDFLALVSNQYTKWHEFSDYLSFVFKAFQDIYHIQYATRIGLRYINVLTFQNTRTNTLSELIGMVRDEVVVLFRISEIEEPYVVKQEIRAKVDDDGDFTIRIGLVEEKREELALDFDRYTDEQVSVDDLIERCHRYHRDVYNAFRWVIIDEKMRIFEPANEV
jgi:uncharacterized protein (TIGR04255 family)